MSRHRGSGGRVVRSWSADAGDLHGGSRRVADHVDRRLALPWLTMAGVFVVAAGAHVALGRDRGALPVVVMMLTAATCGLTDLAWRLAHDRSAIGRRNLAGNVFGALGFITVSVMVPPWSRWPLTVWAIAGAAMALTWNLRNAAHAQTGDDGDALGRAWRDDIAPRVGLEGSKLRTREVTAERISADLQLERGTQTIDDVKRRVGNIASAGQLPRNGVRLTPDPDDSSRVAVTLIRTDQLRGPGLPYPAPGELAGASIADAPVPLGRYEDGLEASLYLLERHLMVNGMTGSGKTQGALVVLAGALYRRDVAVWVIDAVKGDQTFAELAPAIDWYATTTAQANAMFDALVKLIAARAQFLGEHRRKRWDASCWDELGVPFILVLIEEAPSVIGHKGFTQTVERARSVGVGVICSMQRASWQSVNTTARAQFGAALQFGVKDLADVFVLSDDVVERGADPSVWQARQQFRGYAYLEQAEADVDRDIVPLRTFLVTDAELEDATAYRLAHPVALDAVSESAAGRAYQARRLHVVTDLPGDVVDVDVAIDPDDEDAVDELERAAVAALATAVGAGDDELDGETGLDDEQPARLAFGAPPADRVTPAEARDALRAVLRDWAQEGRRFQPVDLAELATQLGRTPGWVRKQMPWLLTEGLIEEVESGGYRATNAAAL